MRQSTTAKTVAHLRAENEHLRAENEYLRALLAAAPAPPAAEGVSSGPPIWFDSVSDAIIVVDATWRIQHWNTAAAQLYGWPCAEVLGRHIHDLIPIVHCVDGASDQAIIQVLSAVGSWRGMFVQRTRDGREVVVDGATRTLVNAQGVITGYIGINRDVTARVQAEQALTAAYAQIATHAANLDSLLTHAPIGIALMDTTLRYRHINAHLAAINGLPPEAHLGKTVQEVLATLAPILEPIFAQVLTTGEPLFNREIVGMTRAAPGELRTWDASYFPVRAADGALLGVGSIVVDITAQRRAEQALSAHTEALSRTNAELSRALRLKDEFLAMMSHELRTPLTLILGFTESLREGYYGPVNDQQHQPLARVIQGGRQLLAILSDILDLAHIDAGKTTIESHPIEVESFTQAVLERMQPAAQRQGVQVRRTVAAGITALRADGPRLRQILVNLLDNAIKFTPAGGAVGLDVTADRAQGRIQFVVWDCGIGIAEADYGRLFQPFTQVDGQLSRRYGGIGLGLTLVRRLVDLHGGGIQMESTPGQGSRFTVSLPWPALAAPVSLAPTWTHPPRIVFADDHEPTLAGYLAMLTQQGGTVAIARTGDEAMAQVRATRPDVVIMDLQMPGVDGLAAIRQIHADPTLAPISVIALSALALPGDRERCLTAGASAYLTKPAGTPVLVAAIEAVLATAGPSSIGTDRSDSSS